MRSETEHAVPRTRFTWRMHLAAARAALALIQSKSASDADRNKTVRRSSIFVRAFQDVARSRRRRRRTAITDYGVIERERRRTFPLFENPKTRDRLLIEVNWLVICSRRRFYFSPIFRLVLAFSVSRPIRGALLAHRRPERYRGRFRDGINYN